MLSELNNGKLTQYTYNQNNQLIAKQTEGVYYSYLYDRNGNLISRTKDNSALSLPNETQQYYYDTTNRMVKGVNANGEQSIYQYNGLGVLIANEKYDNANTQTSRKEYVADYTSPLQNVIMEAERVGDTYTQLNVYGLNKISSDISDTKLYYHHDRLGSTRFVTDSMGAIAGFTDYDEWGNPTTKSLTSVGLTQLDITTAYTGYRYDDTLDIYFAKARMYDAADKHFTARDLVKGSIAAPLTLAAYTYVLDNPLKWVDPWGLEIAKVTINGRTEIIDTNEYLDVIKMLRMHDVLARYKE